MAFSHSKIGIICKTFAHIKLGAKKISGLFAYNLLRYCLGVCGDRFESIVLSPIKE